MDIEKTLREKFPHGHKKYVDLLMAEADLHSRKNYDYASGGDPLGNFKRVAKILGQYSGLDLGNPAVIALVYMMKQVDATLWLLSNGHEAQVEGFSERLQDVSVYAKIVSIILGEQGPTGGFLFPPEFNKISEQLAASCLDPGDLLPPDEVGQPACGNHLMCQECEIADTCTILPPSELVQDPDYYKVGGTD